MRPQRLIKADNLSVMLKNEDTDMFEVIFGSGKKSWPKRGFKVGEGIAGNVVLTGKAEIVNHVQADPRYEDSANKISSLMCAPLKIKDKVIGVINISSEEPVRYTAEELKILSALAFQAAAAIENARLYDQLKDTFLNTVNTLAETIEKRDPYTGGHTRRVMDYSVSIAKTLKLSDRQIENIRLAAILHDIGKIGVRDSILLKNEKLSTEESNTIKMHPIYAEEILSPIKNLKDIIPGIKYHHERFDGQGYPERLKGDEIDIMARIIAVADAFDAMTSDRPYRKGLSTDVAMEELKKNLGTQFDPEVVRAFIKVYEANKQSK
jgi:HD-GYP domain-containing protein (c-di-GMP phosphodiesterase class II)